MEQLIHSLELCVKTKNWYAALMLALTLPDIAGKIENPTFSGQKRYADWFDRYVGHKYKSRVFGMIETVLLSGNDCYALRCSFLHEGKSDIIDQRAREILDDFQFTIPPAPPLTIHCNKLGNSLQLQVDLFCSDILCGLKTWLADISKDSKKQALLNNLLALYLIKMSDSKT